MTKGVVFFTYGPSPEFLLRCALWSIRKVYDGPLHVLHSESTPRLIRRIAKLPNTTVGEYVPDPDFMNFEGMHRRRAAWCMKAHGHASQYPYDVNLYYDLDHVWLKPLDDSIFDEAAEHGLVNPWNHRSKPVMHSRISSAEHVPAIPEYITANGGCVCARKGSKEVMEWLRLTKLNYECDNRTLHINPEECALAIMLSTGEAKALTHRWSAPFELAGDPDVSAVHCYRGSYGNSPEWRRQMRDAWKAKFLGIHMEGGREWKDRIWNHHED